MTMVGANFVSTQFLANSLVAPVMQAQSSLTTAMTEESTGQYADLGLQLGDQSGYELSLKEQIGQLQTLTSGNSLVSTSLSTAQAALTDINSSAQSTLNSLATWTPTANSGDTLQNMGQSALQSLIASTNATSGDQYVFGGINSSVAPLPDTATNNFYSTVTSAVQLDFTNDFSPDPTTADASQANTFLNEVATLFTNSNWTAAGWSQASSQNTSAEIAPGQTVTTSTNANQPGFQQLTQAYALLTVCGGSALSSAAQQVVVNAAESLISQGQASLTNTQAALGATQSQVTTANNSMSSQLTILQDQVGSLDNVNATTTAAQITSLTNQIQMAYELTSRLSQLNLAQYLPVA